MRDLILCFPQCIVREASTPEKRSTTTTLTVSVLDVNDNVPIFQSTQYDVQRPAGTYTVPDALVRVSCPLLLLVG